MEHKFKVGDAVEWDKKQGIRYLITYLYDDNRSCEIKHYDGAVDTERGRMYKVSLDNLKLWEEPEEFEPITRDNIVEVLKYNGFNHLQSTDVGYVLDKDIVITPVGIKVPYAQVTFENHSWLKHLELYTGKLKPLPKKKLFNVRQFLLDNGFEIDEFDIITYKGMYFGIFSLAAKELYLGNQYSLTKENLQKLVGAAKILEGLE
jgi:hypothetical protein